MIYTNNITSKGQLTIPKEFRDKAGLTANGKAQIHLNDQNEIVISKAMTQAEVREYLAQPGTGEPLSAHDQQRGQELIQKYGIR